MDELYAVPNFKLRAFAIGDYSCKCRNCGAEFTGDKRALICLPCALNQGDKRDVENAQLEAELEQLKAKVSAVQPEWFVSYEASERVKRMILGEEE